MKETEIKKGVADSWDFWLSQHPITVGDVIEDAIRKSFRAWLDEHSNEIVERIATSAQAELKERL